MKRKSDRTAAEKALRRKVEQRLGSVREEEWRFLREGEHLATALDEEEREPGEGAAYLAETLEQARRYASLTVQDSAPRARKRRLSASERLIQALRRLQARAAEQLPEVSAWRREWLPNGLLAPEQVKSFLMRPQRLYAVWTVKAAVQGEPPEQPPADAEVIEQRLVWEPQESLDKLAGRLADRFGWSRQAAATWVVTGVLPDQPAVLVEQGTSFPGEAGAALGLPPCSFLRLTVPVFLTPAQVADRLRRIRTAGGSRLRSLSAKTAALLEHVAEHGTERGSWKEWRRRHGGFPQFKHFRQAVKRAAAVLSRAAL